MSFEEELEIVKKTEGILLSDMNLSVRLYNCLRRAGYISLVDIMLADSCKFREIRNFGRTSEEELNGILSYVRNATREEIIARINLNIACADENCIVTPNAEKTVIEVALGQRLNVGNILFKDSSGNLVEDISVYEILFSNRVLNFLSKNKILSLRSLSNLPYGELENAQGLGEKCIAELMNVISERVTSIHLKEDVGQRIVELANRVIAYYSAILVDIDAEKMYSLLQKALIGLCLKGETIESLEEKEMSFFLSFGPLKSIVSERIYSDAADTIIVGTDIELLCYAYGFNGYELKKAFYALIESLHKEKRVRIIDNKLYKYKFFLNEWIETLDGNFKVALTHRCEGMTLEEVGDVLEVTRERIRQIVSKGLERHPALYEEDYAPILEKYAFTDAQFAELFGVTLFQINFLRLNHKKGSGDIQEFLADNTIPELYKERVGRVFRDSIVLINGECVPLKREILLERLLHTYFADEECTTEQFEKFYIDFLAENGLAKNENLLFPTSRAFEARIIDYPYTIYKLGRRIRYYDTTAPDIDALLLQTNIIQYNNMEISTLKIFRESPEVMDAYDIRDEYELHNLLRKRIKDISCADISITRMPFITVGVADRFQQVEELLLQNAPISNYDLAVAYEERYGVQKETVLANFFTQIDVYFHDGIFDLEQEELPEEDYVKMQEALTGDIYLWSEVIAIYKTISSSSKEEAINAMTLKKLGYKVYSQYVINNKYSSADAYITYLLTRNPKFDLNEIDAGIRRLQIFYSAFNNLRESLDLIEIDKDIFVTFEYFQSNYKFVSKDELKEIVAQIITNQDFYFSINGIANSGICDFNFGIVNNVYFLNSIIRVQDGIKTAKMGEVYIASRGGELSHLGLISHLIHNYGETNIYDLLERLKSLFGIKIDKSRVIYVMETSQELYYDGVFEVVCKGCAPEYLNADDFWNGSRAANIVADKKEAIACAEVSIAQVYWKDKFTTFLDYCGEHSLTLMRDLFEINFDNLYKKASDYNLSKNIVSDIMKQFAEWVKNYTDNTSRNEESMSIFDLFFK